MTLDELLTFLKLAEIKNFNKTAESLFTSQSTVSARIKNLETELGQTLVFRDKKNVELTPSGSDFLNYANSIVSLWGTCKRTLSISGSYQRQITIVAPDSHWTSLLFPSLTKYFDQSREASFKLLCHHSWIVNQMIAKEQADIGITCHYMPHPELEYIYLQGYPYVLVCHPQLEILDKPLDASNIDQFPLIYCNWGEVFLDWFNKQYKARSRFLEVEQVFMLQHLLRNKKGIAFVPERIVKEDLKMGLLKKILFLSDEQAPMESSYLIYRKKNHSIVNPIICNILSFLQLQ